MTFIDDDFLLGGETARRLYHRYAEGQPILDYHNHLPPGDIASNRRFGNLFEAWLEGDHYKWRAMRANGVEERLVTGDADPKDKFLAFARTVPAVLRNPLYHWTHLELKRYFGIDTLLSGATAEGVWEAAGERLAGSGFGARELLEKFDVRALCTTDDPVSDLAHHREIAASGCGVRVYPTFRPDGALGVEDAASFNLWCDALAAASDVDIVSYGDFKEALRRRHDDFHSVGGRLSDHGLGVCYADFCSDSQAAAVFDGVRGGNDASVEQKGQLAGNLMLFFGHLDAEKGWTKQLHLGAIRDNNRRLSDRLGSDIGCDSIGDLPQAAALGAYLGRLDSDGLLPKMVVYNLNPSDNYTVATMLGNFAGGGVAGRMQFGSGWWFLDQKEGMEWQMNALSNCGLFSRFVGMLTDSRSFLSFPRHEYFRRILCNLLGEDIDRGYVPDDDSLVGPMIEGVCFGNARDFFGLELG